MIQSKFNYDWQFIQIKKDQDFILIFNLLKKNFRHKAETVI